jgi:hypothetical protein
MPAPVESANIRGGHELARPRLSQRLQYSGSLDSYSYSDLTPVIGREYQSLQITDLLASKDSDQLLRDLAVTSAYSLSHIIANYWKWLANNGIVLVSERGVVFLRNQDITTEQMRIFGEKLTSLAGCVSRSPPETPAEKG